MSYPFIKKNSLNSILLSSCATLLLGSGVALAHGSAHSNAPLQFKSDFVECNLLRVEIQHQDSSGGDHGHGHESALSCIESSTNPNHRNSGIIFDLENVPAGLLQAFERAVHKHGPNHRSANVRLRLNNILQDQGRIVFTDTTEWSLPESTSETTTSDSSGTTSDSTTQVESTVEPKEVLVVRIVSTDGSASTLSMDQLSDSVFGTHGDLVNLKSQFEACSYGNISFVPAQGSGITNGVIEVLLEEPINGVSDSTVRNAVTSKLTDMFSESPSALFDHVLYSIPPEANMGGIAYAYVNHWLSVYNDQWVSYPSAQMHEVGHNLGLAHSGEGSTEYGDQSGMMGYSYSSDEGPEMCFNSVKNAQLGWYDDKYLILDNGVGWSGVLTGIANHHDNVEKDIIRLNSPDSAGGLFLTLNAKSSDLNSGTLEGANQVMVTSKAVGDAAYGSSNLKAKLGEGGVYSQADFGGAGNDVTVTVNSITHDGVYYKADVVVSYVHTMGPEANDMQAETIESTPVSITLNTSGATDVVIDTQPALGTVEVTGGVDVLYSPNPGSVGVDSFTYYATDASSGAVSSIATVTVTIVENTAPVADDKEATVIDYNPVGIELTASDANTDQAVEIHYPTQPTHGTLSGDVPNLTYTPNSGLDAGVGEDTFTYTATDELGAISEPATIRVTFVNNSAPVVSDLAITVSGKSQTITLQGSDADGDALSYSIVDYPVNGTIQSISGNQVTYKPRKNFTGSDSFIYKAFDGKVHSNIGQVSLTVVKGGGGGGGDDSDGGGSKKGGPKNR